MTRLAFLHQIEDLLSDLFVKLIPHVLTQIFIIPPDHIKLDMKTIMLPFASLFVNLYSRYHVY